MLLSERDNYYNEQLNYTKHFDTARMFILAFEILEGRNNLLMSLSSYMLQRENQEQKLLQYQKLINFVYFHAHFVC